MLQPAMRQRQTPVRQRSITAHDAQLSLAIDAPALVNRLPESQRANVRAPRVTRAIDVEPILWMRDVVELTGMHRCTIHRWILNGTFPKKDAPRRRPTGWLRSTYAQWLLGAHASRTQERRKKAVTS